MRVPRCHDLPNPAQRSQGAFERRPVSDEATRVGEALKHRRSASQRALQSSRNQPVEMAQRLASLALRPCPLPRLAPYFVPQYSWRTRLQGGRGRGVSSPTDDAPGDDAVLIRLFQALALVCSQGRAQARQPTTLQQAASMYSTAASMLSPRSEPHPLKSGASTEQQAVMCAQRPHRPPRPS